MFFRRISGRSEADTAAGTSVRGMLVAVFGRGPRGGAVDARAAAQSLGVSPGTVRRWASGVQKPTAGRLQSIRQAARRVTTTKRGRRAATADFRASARGSQALKVGTKIWVSGVQGVNADPEYVRDRLCAEKIEPNQIEDLLRAYEDGGDPGLRDALRDFYDENYVADWDFLTIDDFGFGTPD